MGKGDTIIKPILYYYDESCHLAEKIPVANRWVVYFLFPSDRVKRMSLHLAKTNDKGVMYSCHSDIKYNERTREFTLTKAASPPFMKKHYSDKYHPVKFNLRQKIGIFLWPYRKVSISESTVSIEYLKKKRLVVGGHVRLASKIIFMRASLEIYLDRLRHYTKILKKKNDAYESRIKKSMTCAAILDQSYNLIIGRGKGIQASLGKSAASKGLFLTQDRILGATNIEGKIIGVEVVDEMRKKLNGYVKGETGRYKDRISMVVCILSAILQSREHNWQFLNTDWTKYASSEKDEPPESIIDNYNEAYIALMKADTEMCRQLYKDQFEEFIKKSAKGAESAKKALDEINKKVSWIGKITDGILKINAAARTYQMAKKLTKIREDLLGVCYYLQVRGVLKNIEDLDENLEDIMKNIRQSRKYRISVDSTPYFNETAPLSEGVAGNVKGAISSGISLIALLAAYQKESKNFRDEVDKATAVYGFSTSVMDIPGIQKYIPKGATVSKVAGVAGSVVDWGISIYDMNAAAETGKGEKFAYSVVSYAGKGLIAGGAVLSVTPLAPLGVVLIAVGVAIDLIGSLVQGVSSFQTIKEEQFNYLMSNKLKENDPTNRKWLSTHYEEVLLVKKVKNTNTFKYQKIGNPEDAKLYDDAYKDLNFKKFIHYFFRYDSWVVQYEKL
jgi:hypothetical protein